MLAAVVVTLGACGDADEPAPVTACGDVAFTPQTDDGAFGIRASGTDCATARTVARATRDRDPGDPLAFTVAGFRCAGTRTPDAVLPGVDWRCRSGERVVTFTRN